MTSMRDLGYLWVYPEYTDARRHEELARVARLALLGYRVEAFGIPCPGGWWPFDQLDARWRQRDRGLMVAYEKLAEALRDRQVLIAAGGSMLHPEFVRQLSAYSVFLCSDDPESTAILSRPVAPAFDYAMPFNIACVEDYRAFGCQRVAWLFHALDPTTLDPTITESSILERGRDLDIVTLAERGDGLSDRARRLETLTQAFPRAIVRGHGWPGGRLSDAAAKAALRNARVGWNLHHSRGPCNTRTWGLPAFGVLEVCDNKSWLGQIFALGREVVGFDSLAECIDATRYYLANEAQRRTIAAGGFRRVMTDYTEAKQWQRILDLIETSCLAKLGKVPLTTPATIVRSQPESASGKALAGDFEGSAPVSAGGLEAVSHGPQASDSNDQAHGGRSLAVVSNRRAPRILLLADRRGWAFDHDAQGIAKELDGEFEFAIRYVAEQPDLNAWPFDLLFVFFWGETWHQRFGIDRRRTLKCVTSYRWREASFGLLTPMEFVDRHLADAGTICATSRRLQALLAPYRTTGYTPDAFDPAQYAFGAPRQGPLRIGWVGNRNDPCKGLDDILLPAMGGDFELRIAGGDLSQAQVAAFYQDLDVLCVASTAEGAPLPLIEAMACGCFPVAVDVGVVSELVQHGRNGLIIERSPAAFRAALQWCQHNVERIRAAGATRAHEVLGIRSWRAVAAHWRAAFHAGLAAAGTLAQPSTGSTAQDAQRTLKTGYGAQLRAINPGTTGEGVYQAASFYYAAEVLPLLPEAKTVKVLEIGSGYGHLLRFLHEQGWRDLTGVELDPEIHGQAQLYLGSRARIELGDALDYLSNNTGRFDVVVALDVIEHFPLEGARTLVERIHAALVPGGVAIIRTPNMANLFGSYSRSMDLTHQCGFTEQSLAHLLGQVGFEACRVHVPAWDPAHPLTKGLLESRELHTKLFAMQDRATPRCFEKNVVVSAHRPADVLAGVAGGGMR